MFKNKEILKLQQEMLHLKNDLGFSQRLADKTFSKLLDMLAGQEDQSNVVLKRTDIQIVLSYIHSMKRVR